MPGAILQWKIHMALGENDRNGVPYPVFSAHGSEECNVENLKRFSADVEALRVSRDMAIRFEGFEGACDLSLRMVDYRRGTVLVESALYNPGRNLSTPSDVFQICEDHDFPGALRIAFLTDQSSLAVTNSQISTLLRFLQSLRENE
jgi:hypothetical protein